MASKSLSAKKRQSVIRALVKKHGARTKEDVRRGVERCARVWDFKRESEARFEEFCLQQYMPPGKARNQLLERLDEFHHHVTGNMGATAKVARAGIDIADRPLTAAERVLGAFSASPKISGGSRSHPSFSSTSGPKISNHRAIARAGLRAEWGTSARRSFPPNCWLA